MPIIGLTHEKDGSPRIHRAVVTKVSIGLAPDEQHNYPDKLDHFAFLKQQIVGKELKWVIDQEKQSHYGENCKTFFIVLLDDDLDVCFRSEYAAWVKTRCWCRGDGEKAQRREKIDGEYKGDFKIWNQPCANNGCPDAEPNGDKPAACKPSGDLYFLLSDFPTLGTICRIHTSSKQSVRQIYSALQDLRAVTGGRLMGVRCKLFVSPARNVYERQGKQVTGIKFVLGLELAAKDIPELMESMSKTALMFQGLQKQLAGRVLEIEEDDAERAPEMASEFYAGKMVEGEVVQPDPEKQQREECDRLMTEDGFNTAQRQAKLGQYTGKMAELKAKILDWRGKAKSGNGHNQGGDAKEAGQPVSGHQMVSKATAAPVNSAQEDPLTVTQKEVAQEAAEVRTSQVQKNHSQSGFRF